MIALVVEPVHDLLLVKGHRLVLWFTPFVWALMTTDAGFDQ